MKRWPVIRHVRWLAASLAFAYWWDRFGKENWLTPNPADLRYLDAIWRGEA